jgi:anti-anti-sigma regulatory factor
VAEAGSRSFQDELALTLFRPDPTTVVLRPAGRLDRATVGTLRHWLAENIVFHAHVLVDLTCVMSDGDLAATVIEDARRSARDSHVTLSVLGARPEPHHAEPRRGTALGWHGGRTPRHGHCGRRVRPGG